MSNFFLQRDGSSCFIVISMEERPVSETASKPADHQITPDEE
jgi:hypothetical protein